MRDYAIRRLLLVIPTLLLATIIAFLLMRLIPGDIVDLIMIQAEGSQVDRAAVERALGLDVPIYTQYFRWLGAAPDVDGSFSGLLQGSLGTTLWTKIPVTREIVPRLPVSVELGILGFLIMNIMAVPIGVYSAIRQDTAGDYTGRSFATLLITVPSFWAGVMFLLVASLWFGYAPPLGVVAFTEEPIEHLKQFLPAAFVLGMAGTGVNMRMVRSMMLEVLRQDYIRTAWAKGLRERVVIVRHTLRNALIPVVTMIALQIPVLLGGTVIIETIFNLPGTGRLLLTAIDMRDYTIVTGILLFFGVGVALINLMVDLTYGFLDPRIRYK